VTLDLFQQRRDYLAELQAEQSGYQQWTRLAHQEPPEGDWFFWLLEGGRGSGKTVAAVSYMRDHLNGPPCLTGSIPHRASLIAPTIGDAVESAEMNDISLVRSQPGAVLTQARGGSLVRWPNGSQVRLFGAYTKEDYERLRAGGNRCIVWAEELATWRRLKDAWDQMMFGLRIGPRPRVIGSTTPKPRPEYIKIRGQAAHISRASTADNPHLNRQQRDALYELHDGTALGKQELHGELVEEAEGALWSYELIHAARFDDPPATIARTVVAVDPPGGVTEAGIVACALLPECRCDGERLPHFAVLADRSAKLSPDGWGSRTVDLYHELTADRVVGEVNFGGDMVDAVIRNTDSTVAYKSVRASRGKRQRAEPVKALYEQGRVHHVGTFSELEAEMVQWVPDESSWSPNRVDALVWALTELGAGKTGRLGTSMVAV